MIRRGLHRTVSPAGFECSAFGQAARQWASRMRYTADSRLSTKLLVSIAAIKGPLVDDSGSWPTGVAAIDHTADWAIRITAPSAAELFRRAAFGLYHLAGMRLARRPRRTHPLQVEAADWESVLVAWLNELLFLKEQRNEAYPEIEVVAIDHRHLSVLLRGGRVAAWTRDIKAVTYHNLQVVAGPDVWQATLVLDV